MSKKKNVLARVGNFEVTKDSLAHDYIRIKSADGSWGITHRDDTPMYGAWMQMCKDPEYAKAMEVLIVMAFHLTNSFIDKEFADDFFTAYAAMQKRRIERAPEPTDKEGEEAVEEVAIMEEAKKVLEGNAE